MYLLRPRRDSYGQAFSLYMFDNVNYVSWCTVRGASVFMLEYRSDDTQTVRARGELYQCLHSCTLT